MRLHSKITPDRWAAIAVSLLPLIYFLPATRGHIVIAPDDGVIFNVPLRVAAANLLHAGQLPLWNPYIFCGMPLFAAAQAGVLFPLNWFYLLFSAPVATNLMMLSSYMVAALGAYLYARRGGSSVAGAVLTSLVWQGSGFLIGQIGHTNTLHTAALLPWLLWAIDGYGETGKRSRGLLLALVVAVQVFAGHQQTLVYALLVATAYALVRWREQAVGDQSRRAYPRSVFFIAAGLVLAAVQLIPTLELLRHSMRSEASYDFFSSFSLPPDFLWTFLAPYVVGGGDGRLFRAPYVGPAFYAEYVGYVGLATVALALVALGLKRDALTKFWGVVVLAGVTLALGRHAPFDLYKLIYAVPVLNLFRVPARHLMEVEFALAVLAGRGLTAIAAASDRAKVFRWVAVASATVFVLACLSVTAGRPATFQLGRMGPVSILRAPELFLPILLAAGSGWALCNFARRRRRALLWLVAVVALDLCLWGQSTGWRVASPRPDFELWREPAAVRFLRERAAQDHAIAPARILTQDYFFDPNQTVVVPKPGAGWVPSLQPNIYMMHGVENAAGYDGFGLARYSQLAGDMKIWGDLGEAERTLRSESRELDLLNVRYLFARSSAATTDPAPERLDFPAATEVYRGEPFAEESLNVKGILSGERLSFRVPPVEVDHIALLTNMAWSDRVPDHEIVAVIRLHAKDGRTFHFEIRAGDHTSEWAHDRPEIEGHIQHRRAPVATSYEVKDGQTKYEAHTYLCTFTLPQRVMLEGGEIMVARVGVAPQLSLIVNRLTLVDGERGFPLRTEWLKKETVASADESVAPQEKARVSRWKPLLELGNVAIFENTRMLPRAWVAAGELVATGEEQLSIIRSGKTPAGASWNPLEQALVETRTGLDYAKVGESAEGRVAEVTRSESGRIELKTESAAPSLLVLAENHYPGWRASVDGRTAEIVRVNYNQRGVALPAGKHLVTFVYRPISVLVGLAVSLLTLAALWWWAAGAVSIREKRVT
jgi:Bacterial membrane protein YfhO